MKRKDYIVIADAVVSMIELRVIKIKAIDEAITIICRELKSDNYMFDEQKFKTYIKERIA